MRYLVKVYTLTDEEEARVSTAVEAGLLQEAERLSGFTQGTADANGIASLVQRGLNAMSVEEIAGTDALSRVGQTVRSFATKALSPFGVQAFSAAEDPQIEVERPDGRQNYLLGRISGSLTPKRLERLSDAGVHIVEKRSFNTYVIKASSAATLNTLEFVTDLTTYGAEDTLPGGRLPSSVLPPTLQEFEAIVHADADAKRVAGELAGMGASVTSSDGRSIRFARGNADLEHVADLPDVAQLQEAVPPKLLDDAAHAIVGFAASPNPPFGALDGSGQVVGVADTGIDEAHPDLVGRFVGIEALGRPGDHGDPNGHGTHVTGTIAASGAASDGEVRGAAPGVRIYFQSLLDQNGRLGGLPGDIGALFSSAYAAGVRVHNNSWGAFLEARYGSNSIQVDRFVHAHPDFLPVIAAGNNGRCFAGEGPRSSAPGFVEFPSIATPASAKNGLTVGASRSDRTLGGYSRMTWGAMWSTEFAEDPIASETVSGNAQALAAFSSRGPVENDVVKPDLVAPGTDIASTRSSAAPLRNFWGAFPNNPAYAFMGGTSMAAPLVTAAAAIVRQYYQDARGHSASAALVKATLINGTTRLTHVDAVADPVGEPNYHQGFGRLDMGRTLPNPAAPGLRLCFVDTMADPALEFAEPGPRRSWDLRTVASGELRLCLAWTDFPASGLQNSLILFLDELGTDRKWVSNERVPQAVKLPARIAPGVLFSRDPKNNVQVIRVSDVVAGNYLVSVIASNVLFAPQGFALVATGAIAGIVLR